MNIRSPVNSELRTYESRKGTNVLGAIALSLLMVAMAQAGYAEGIERGSLDVERAVQTGTITSNVQGAELQLGEAMNSRVVRQRRRDTGSLYSRSASRPELRSLTALRSALARLKSMPTALATSTGKPSLICSSSILLSWAL